LICTDVRIEAGPHGLALLQPADDGAQVAQGHRAAQQVALDKVAALLGEKLVLLQGFHTFGDHLQVQRVGHDNDCLDDLHVLPAARYILDERAVDLQGVQGQALEVGQ